MMARLHPNDFRQLTERVTQGEQLGVSISMKVECGTTRHPWDRFLMALSMGTRFVHWVVDIVNPMDGIEREEW